ncbi:hypothetical protein Acsp04_60820 [Actinomadura sp. NBRC 104425]|uniref:hypothetical protein n=1 Tax=Actinomadura sp. NBRC 104425 TaxID=3032204 RepID=UPI0024A149AF|nr:hypothetical protein [Actinomadura sp. NBRC 104425]GLZ15847.1 hypothetical protein Acsp04_60820 [Actinomadura sp. NBRC 104425]
MSDRYDLTNELVNLADAVRDALTVPEPAGGEWADYYHTSAARGAYVRDALAGLAGLSGTAADLDTVRAALRAAIGEIERADQAVKVTYPVSAGRCPTCRGQMWQVRGRDGTQTPECPWCDHDYFGEHRGGVSARACPECRGEGRRWYQGPGVTSDYAYAACDACGGEGLLEVSR